EPSGEIASKDQLPRSRTRPRIWNVCASRSRKRVVAKPGHVASTRFCPSRASPPVSPPKVTRGTPHEPLKYETPRTLPGPITTDSSTLVRSSESAAYRSFLSGATCPVLEICLYQ